MTERQINEAIAIACGWRKEEDVWFWTHDGIDFTSWETLDYCGCLNAMHEAEMVLTKDRNSYLTTLAGLVETDHLRGLDADWPWVCATARQRAEAFLRTLGKWEEEE